MWVNHSNTKVTMELTLWFAYWQKSYTRVFVFVSWVNSLSMALPFNWLFILPICGYHQHQNCKKIPSNTLCFAWYIMINMDHIMHWFLFLWKPFWFHFISRGKRKCVCTFPWRFLNIKNIQYHPLVSLSHYCFPKLLCGMIYFKRTTLVLGFPWQYF